MGYNKTQNVQMRKKVKNIAIVEDEADAKERICGCIKQFSEERGEQFNVTVFGDAVSFLEGYKPDYDVVFMDIMLPGMNGMDAAAKLRKIDANVALVFVTNMSQYAVNGYAVDALDFIIKPVRYPNFALKFQRVLGKLNEKVDIKLTVVNEEGMVCVSASSIKYVEVMQLTIIYHTADRDIPVYGSLKKIEDILPKRSFIRCNSCYLVNLRYVTAIRGQMLILSDGTELKISTSKRKELIRALNNYLGGGA